MRRRTRGLSTCLFAISLTAGLASDALAGDGVIEINQSRALEGGVTAGDAAGFPVTISVAGSYRLTGNLDLRGQNNPQHVTAISITADRVSIDLNGFEILGSTVCVHPTSFPNPSVTCSPTGSGSGVAAPSRFDVTVRNGAVRGMGSWGVMAGENAIVEGVHARGNGWVGIGASSGVIRNNTAADNGSDGLWTGGNSVVDGNQSHTNGGSGVRTYGGSLITRNAIFGNARYGIELPNGYASWTANQLSSNTLGATYQEPGFWLTSLGQNACDSWLCP